jgi:hypothetical protein
MGLAGREHVIKHASLESMVEGYQSMMLDVYESKCLPRRTPQGTTHLPEPELLEPVEL